MWRGLHIVRSAYPFCLQYGFKFKSRLNVQSHRGEIGENTRDQLAGSLIEKIKLKAFEGLSLYDLIEMYLVGIVKGALSTRASSIAFSIFWHCSLCLSFW